MGTQGPHAPAQQSIDRAIGDYERHGRIKVVGDRNAAYERMADRWLDRRNTGRDVVMLAGKVRDVDALNRAARERLRSAGVLGSIEVAAADRRFAIGDAVVARRNAYDIGILNGTRASVTAVDPGEQTLHVRTEHGSEIAIPHDYLREGHLDHGYAMTVHKAQGATFDHALMLTDETMSRERAYTGLSRGREANELYVVDPEPARDPHAPEIEPAPLDGLATQLHTSSADVMALDLADDLDDLGLGL